MESTTTETDAAIVENVDIPPTPPLPPLTLPEPAVEAPAVAEPVVDESAVDEQTESDEPEASVVGETPAAESPTVDEPVAEAPAALHTPVEETIAVPPVAEAAREQPVEEAVIDEPVDDPAVDVLVVEASPEVVTEDAVDQNLVAEDLLVDDFLPEDSTAEPAMVVVPEALAEPLEDVAGEPAPALALRGVVKQFGHTRAVDAIDLTIPAGSFFGLVGPNGAGKTTTLSMIAGLLRPDSGTIEVCGVDTATDPSRAKKLIGVLPDRLRTFDRLTGRQLLYYYGVLRGLSSSVVQSRIADLARAFDLVDALGRVVSDYSAGMTKKVMLAGAMIHSPRVLVLDEPFESLDPASSQVILDILETYVAHGGTVVLSSHGMALVERVCTRVAVLVEGEVLAAGTVDEVRGEMTLEQRFVELSGGVDDAEGLEWLHTFSD